MKFTLIAATSAIMLPAALFAQSQTINLGYNGPADAEKNSVHFFASTLQELVQERSDFEISLYPNSQLGGEQERMENTLATPSLNIASFAGLSPIVPEVFVANTPFMFADAAEAREFFDEGAYWTMVEDAFRQRTGSEILAVVEEGGFLAFTSKSKAIHEPADFQGMRFRAMDPSQVALYEAMGASGTPIPWTEVYSALQTGVADGQMNPPAYIIMGSLNEVQQYMTDAKVQYSMQFLIGNGSWFNGLSEADQAMLTEAVAEANTLTRADVEASVSGRVQWLTENGMEVITPTADQMVEFQKVGQPSFIDWLSGQRIDQSFIDAAFDDLGKSELLTQ